MKIIFRFIVFSWLFLLNGNVWAGGCIAGLTRVTLSRQTEVDSFPINYSGCTMIYGDLIVSGNNITNLNGLSALTHIYGMLSIQDNPLLLNLNGLNRIDSAENLTIENNTSLTTLNGLNNLTYAYYLSILDNPLLINFNGLNSLKSVNGGFDIRGNKNLINLIGLDNLTKVYGLSITRNSMLINLDGLQHMTTVRSIHVEFNESLKDLIGLSGVKSTGSCVIGYNSSMISLEGLNNFDSCNGDVFIQYNASLKDLKGLRNLRKVLGFLDIIFNPVLINLEGLNNVAYARVLHVFEDSILTTFNGINPLIKIENIYVYENPKLNCCFLVKQILENNVILPTSIAIYNNDIGCSSEAEVRALTQSATCCVSTFKKDTISICQGDRYAVGTHNYNASGIYYDSIHIGAHCDSIIITNLTVHPKSYQIVNKKLCTGQQFRLSNGRIITTNGTYKDTIPNFCDSIIEYHITFENNITVSQVATICQGKTYSLPKGAIVKTSGVYKDTMRSYFGCDSIITTTLTVTNPIVFSKTDSICDGQTYTLPSGKAITSAGIYTDTLRNASTCDSVIITTLSVFPNTFSIQLNSIDSIDAGNNIHLKPTYINDIAITWNWSPVNNLSCTACENPIANPTKNTAYFVKARAQNGCEDTAQTTIIVHQQDVYIPAAFSPNNDGINDELTVFVNNPLSFRLTVFSRWNELVFESNYVNHKWNGTYKNQEEPVDEYFYVLDVTTLNGKIHHKQGVITLLR